MSQEIAMKWSLFVPTLTVLALWPLPAEAVDWDKIDRTIAKEPPYQAKPKYCLVVYGPEAKTRVWLVLDGDVLYVDRNGDGDLTGKDERVLKTSAYDVSIAERDG